MFILNLIAFCTTVLFVALFVQTFISILLKAFQPWLLVGFRFSVVGKKVKIKGSLRNYGIFLRMLLEVQTKLALTEAEAERTKESCLAQMTKLQEKLEEQTEDLKRELEAERSR